MNQQCQFCEFALLEVRIGVSPPVSAWRGLRLISSTSCSSSLSDSQSLSNSHLFCSQLPGLSSGLISVKPMSSKDRVFYMMSSFWFWEAAPCLLSWTYSCWIHGRLKCNTKILRRWSSKGDLEDLTSLHEREEQLESLIQPTEWRSAFKKCNVQTRHAAGGLRASFNLSGSYSSTKACVNRQIIAQCLNVQREVCN